MSNLSISEIDRKIALFRDALTKPFVPEDEKTMAREAIARLEDQKKGMLAKTQSQPVQMYQQFQSQATQHQDTEIETWFSPVL